MARDEKRNTMAHEAIIKVREEWHQTNSKKPTQNNTCPTCGQELPMDQIDAAIKSFNQAKAQRLEKINQEGKQLKAGIEAREKDILAAKEAIDSLAECIQGIDSTLEIKIKELAEISTAKADTSALEQKKSGLKMRSKP